MNHPFKKTEYTDIEVKLEDTTLYISSDLLNDLTHVNSLTEASCSSINDVGVSNNQLENDEPCTSGSTGKNGNEVINLSAYLTFDVVEFFKHLYPEQNAKLTDRNNLKTMLDLCQRFSVEWLKTKVEQYLVNLVEKKDNHSTEAHLSMYLSLATEFNLENLKDEIQEELIYKFQIKHYQKQNDAIFHVVSHYNLKNVHKSFEKRMLKSASARIKPYAKKNRGTNVVESYIDYLLIADNHHYEELKKSLLTEEHCVLNSWMEDQRMKNLSEPTLFEIAKRIIAKIFNPFCTDDFPSIALNMLDFIYSERFHVKSEEEQERFIKLLATSESAVEYSSSESEEDSSSESENKDEPTATNNEKTTSDDGKKDSSDIKRQPNPFISTPTTDIEVAVDQTTLHLHGSILRHCSPVFNCMLSGSFKEGRTKKINFPNKDVATVIEFFQFFYSERSKKFEGSSNFEGLLALSQEYQVNWLMKRIEDYMVANFNFKQNITQILIGWKCVEQFPQLHALKSKLINIDTPNYYLHDMTRENLTKFLSLQSTTKYQIVRNNLKRCLKRCKHSVTSDRIASLDGILKFFDKLLLYN